MADEETTYCRLCAEPTPKIQLISPDEDVAVSSKVTTKLLWINIDISPQSPLPSTICFSCFDLLERTWSFLHNTRSAQEKLKSIFVKPNTNENVDCVENTTNTVENIAGKPKDKNWEAFIDFKKEIKKEKPHENETIQIVDDETLSKLSCTMIKSETRSDIDAEDDVIDYNSTDSDLPLDIAVKKKKLRKRQNKNEYDEFDDLVIKSELNVPPILTWDEQICRCAKCDAQCKNITSLQLHSLQIHNRCCTFKCIDCSKLFNLFKTFIKHVRMHNKKLKHCCEFCNALFPSSAEVKDHKHRTHVGAFLTKCTKCGMTFDTSEQLQEHKADYSHKKPGKKRDIKSEFDLKCEHCNKEFKSRSNLQQHKLVHTERSRDFSCHVCGKMFFTKGTLGTHMITHEETKPFKCEFCPLAFRARGNLQSHISLHSGSKPFVCEQCGKSFRVKRHLKSHSIVHTDLMPYVCEYCNKTFRFKTRLNLHLRQHTGAKPYNCIYCQRDFTNGSNFKKHMKRRHGIDTSRQKFNNVVNENDVSSNMNSNST